jgi:hypothetical protein
METLKKTSDKQCYNSDAYKQLGIIITERTIKDPNDPTLQILLHIFKKCRNNLATREHTSETVKMITSMKL